MKIISTVLFSVLLFTSCNEIKKGVASDQIVGNYHGKATIVLKHSMQNVGLNDETRESTEIVTIFKKDNGDVYLNNGFDNIKLSGVSLANNGTTFSIPMQTVTEKDGSARHYEGLQVAELDGIKYDGIYFTESNILKFGYATIIKYDYGGIQADCMVQFNYEYQKRKQKAL